MALAFGYHLGEVMGGADLLAGGEGEGIADWCILARLAEIAAPTLLFHGANDRLLPAEGVFEATRRMRRAELHLYNPGDHRAVNPHNIARVLPYIKSWLAGLP